jgi:hypothetical protein
MLGTVQSGWDYNTQSNSHERTNEKGELNDGLPNERKKAKTPERMKNADETPSERMRTTSGRRGGNRGWSLKPGFVW